MNQDKKTRILEHLETITGKSLYEGRVVTAQDVRDIASHMDSLEYVRQRGAESIKAAERKQEQGIKLDERIPDGFREPTGLDIAGCIRGVIVYNINNSMFSVLKNFFLMQSTNVFSAPLSLTRLLLPTSS